MIIMVISLLGLGSDSLLTELDAAGIRYIRLQPEPGQVMNAGDNDLASKPGMDFSFRCHLLSQKTEHVATAQGLNAVLKQPRIPRCQVSGRTEEEVCCPLTLCHGPVVRHRGTGENAVVSRVARRCEWFQQLWPVDAQLLVEQRLGCRDILD